MTVKPVRVVLAILAAMGFVFLGIGTKLAVDQRHALARVRPVPAIIVGRDIEEHYANGNHAVTYRPVVRFEYQVDGTTRMGDQVGPLPETRSGHWAWRVLDRYEVGQHVTAWVRTDLADQAYLERTASRQPYALMAFGAALVVFMGWLWVRQRRKAA